MTRHGDILCGLSGDIPIFDEICRRSMRFAAACLQHGSSLLRFCCSMVYYLLLVSQYLAEILIFVLLGISLKLVTF